ncbi:hypothetical protein [Caulobacter sp. BP25]|uniref:hypothetical protein n=1 Tax=Caulobacter sp. BP25 TaxID=2048900 RepID=UPI000C12DF98|nr:hypothetical protein [Caulobacter sp. BP25]PHY17507.1 hypothetical protein CSW59_18015 [Caulobacter sp. BP25]
MSEHIGRQARRQTAALRGLIGAFLIGAVSGAGYHIAKDQSLAISPVILGAGFVGLALLAAITSVVYWRNIDEAAREAHKFAWFWGGSSAMLLVLPVPFLIGDARLVALLGQHAPTDWFAIGVTALIIAQLIGYGLVWAGWWLRQR